MQQAVRQASAPLLAALLLVSGIAHAQSAGAGVPSVPVTNTPGLKVGEARLHGFFEYEARLDTAAGFFGVAGSGLGLAPEFINHFRPGLRLELPARWVDLDLNGYADYVWYTGAITPGSQFASRLEGNGNLEVAFNRGGVVEVDVGDSVLRTDRTRTPSIGVGVLSLFNEAHLAVPIRPGGGALEITPRGSYAVEFFQSISGQPAPGCADVSCDPLAVGGLNYQNAQGKLEVKWRFLPKTAALVDATYDARSYFSAAGGPRASLLRLMAGLSGLLTPKLAVVARAGWGRDFGVSGGATFLAQAEVAYHLSETARIKAGYARTLEPAALFGSVRDDRVYVDASALLGGAFTLRLYGAYDWIWFYNNSNRLDRVATVDVGPQYQVTPWFLVGAGYVLGIRTSNGTTAASFNFTRHEGYVRLTLSY